MILHRIVIHEIIKEKNTYESASFLSTELMEVDEDTTRLTNILHGSFSKDTITYGVFNTEDNEFYDNFQRHLSTKTDNSFLVFTSTVLNILSEKIGGIFLAKGGFFVFVEYSSNGIGFLGIFLIRDTEGILFDKDNSNHVFRINTINYLDVNKLAMACRVNLQRLSDSDNNHLSLIKVKSSDISQYFYEWIGVTQPSSTKEFTERLFSVISSIQLPINPETNLVYELNDFREVAHAAIKASENKMVNLRILGEQLYGDPNTIIDYIEENNIQIDTEFRYDTTALNKFRRISVNRDGIRLSFSRGDFDSNKINLSQESGDLITIRSSSLAQKIREEINA